MCVCSTNLGFSMIPGTYYVPDTYVPGISRQKSIRTYVMFRPWTHTSDDSYIYQLSLVAVILVAIVVVVVVVVVGGGGGVAIVVATVVAAVVATVVAIVVDRFVVSVFLMVVGAIA